MSHVFLSDALHAILTDAGRSATKRNDEIRIDDLLAALLKDPIGSRIAAAIAPSETWPVNGQALSASPGGPAIHVGQTLVAFDRAAEQLFSLGANRVLLGEYEPRHLAQAVGELASARRAPFARYGLDPRAWQSALSTTP